MSNSKNPLLAELPRTRARLILFGLFVMIGFSLISVKIAFLASKENKKNIRYSETEKIQSRLDISDRNGYILATNLEGPSVYIRAN